MSANPNTESTGDVLAPKSQYVMWAVGLVLIFVAYKVYKKMS